MPIASTARHPEGTMSDQARDTKEQDGDGVGLGSQTLEAGAGQASDGDEVREMHEEQGKKVGNLADEADHEDSADR
jgi:hypothetical protein